MIDSLISIFILATLIGISLSLFAGLIALLNAISKGRINSIIESLFK